MSRFMGTCSQEKADSQTRKHAMLGNVRHILVHKNSNRCNGVSKNIERMLPSANQGYKAKLQRSGAPPGWTLQCRESRKY